MRITRKTKFFVLQIKQKENSLRVPYSHFVMKQLLLKQQKFNTQNNDFPYIFHRSKVSKMSKKPSTNVKAIQKFILPKIKRFSSNVLLCFCRSEISVFFFSFGFSFGSKLTWYSRRSWLFHRDNTTSFFRKFSSCLRMRIVHRKITNNNRHWQSNC